MISSYATEKVMAQIKAVAFVVVYLLLSQVLLFRVPVEKALSIAFGVGATVFGLAFFLEGLFLGIMPLGKQCGLKLPSRAGITGTALFAIIIGITATLAEPAIGILKAQGSAVSPWDAPLLFYLLNSGSSLLVGAVAVGVGVAVLLGVFRALYGWSFKPLVFLIIPFLIGVGFYFQNNPQLSSVAGLAWDTGGVTTGPVTVPLVIALGVGISRIAGGRKNGASGLGVVTLASALPVMAVFMLALAIENNLPEPGNPKTFFSPAERERAQYTVGGSVKLEAFGRVALERGLISTSEFNSTFYENGESFKTGDNRITYPITQRASEVARLAGIKSSDAKVVGNLVISGFKSLMAVLPLAMVLVLTLVLFLRERVRGSDAVILGLIFAITGMFLFSIGMERGLTALGSQSGASLPRAYESTLRKDKAVTLYGVDKDVIVRAAGVDGKKEYLLVEGDKGPSLISFDRSHWDSVSGIYNHIPLEQAIFNRWGTVTGIIAVLGFVFILGFGSTLAEPSLTALGITVEDLTTGTYKKKYLVAVVAIGVGLGMAVGFARILYDFPLSWILGIAYATALFLTAFSTEDFAAIAWDSAGVTTGPVTVPLVIAAGFGIGSHGFSNSVSFGVVACASVFPIIAVLLSGLFSSARAKARSLGGTDGKH